MERVELDDAPEIATIEITEPLPESGVVDSTYKIKGSVKIFDAIGAPPWVYAEVRLKEWYKPEAAEEVSYGRGFPMPITGEFTIEFKPEKEGDYEITVLATPAPLSLPVIGVFPVTGKSDVMKVAVGERPPAVFRFSGVTIDENDIALTDHDADSGLLLEKTTADYLDITPAFEWTGPSKKATVSIKAGYRDWLGAFSPKTGAYTRTITLPESPAVPYSGELESPIRIPLTACSGITDGAIEMVLKIAGEPDYISRIWNVYATKAPPEALDFDLTRPSVSQTPVDPGTIIDITCPITSRCEKAVDANAKVIIYEGSLLPGHGSKIKEYDSGTFHIEPNESTNVVVHHTTVKGTIDRRDVEVEVYVDTQLVKESEWDDVFYVGLPPEEVIDFNLTRPTVTPAEIAPGTPITITCPVTSACTKEQTATAQVKIYEGSLYAGHGTLVATKTSPAFSIAPGQAYNVIVQHTAIAGTIDRRDVEVEIYIGGKLVKESEWDDVFYVGVPPEEVIDFDLTRPIVTPAPLEIKVGDPITITCPVTSKSTKPQTAMVKVIIYEGSALPVHGARITTKTSPSFDIAPDQTYDVIVHHTAIEGTINQRDVEVEVYVAGKLVKESEWDDIYYVIIPPPPPVPPTSDIRNFDFQPMKGTYDVGDRVYYSAPYEYKGKAQGGWLTIYLGTGVYPYFSIKHTYPRTAVSFDEAMDWTPNQLSGSFILQSIVELGQTYNVRAKLETADGKQETDTDWGVITIPEITPPPPPVPPAADIRNLDFVATKGTYDIGDRVPFTCNYEFKGKAQRGQLVLSLGTGVYPTFSPVVNYYPMEVSFEEAMDWTRRGFTGTFLLTEDLEPGRLYNTRAKLETLEDPTQETDTDWSVIRITEVALEYTLTAIASPSYGGSVSGAGKYGAGTNATLYATPASGYEFDRWGGDASGTSRSTSVYMDRNKSVTAYFKKVVKEYSLTTSVYPSGAGTVTGAGTYRAGIYATLYATPSADYEFDRWSGDASGISRSVRVYMDRDKRAVANFKKKVVPGYTLTVLMSPTAAAGWVRREPDKPSYTYGETVKLTATSAAGYRFSYWTVNGERAGYSSTLTLMVTTDLEVIAYYTKV